MYIDAGSWTNTRSEGERAILESPNIKGSTKTCTMNLFYHMYGRNVGSLLFYIRTDKDFQFLKKISGDQGNQWVATNVSAVSLTDYRIHIIAVYGDGYQGDIAIDDIKFTGSGCVFDSRRDNTYCGKSENGSHTIHKQLINSVSSSGLILLLSDHACHSPLTLPVVHPSIWLFSISVTIRPSIYPSSH